MVYVRVEKIYQVSEKVYLDELKRARIHFHSELINPLLSRNQPCI
jgi:hypothetical protein